MNPERLRLRIGIECDKDYFDEIHDRAWVEGVSEADALTQQERSALAEEVFYQTELVFDQFSAGNFQGDDHLISSVFDNEMNAFITTLALEGKEDDYRDDFYIYESAYFHVVRYQDRETDQDLAYELFVSENRNFYQRPPEYPAPRDVNIARRGKLAGLFVAKKDFSEIDVKGLAELVEANETLGSLCKMAGIALPDSYFVRTED